MGRIIGDEKIKKKSRKSVEAKLELGHRAVLREKPTTEGFTHDWTVFVKGCEGSNISHFVDKVVFHLHESFPKPKRVVKEPPYQVKECGYAGFIMPIEVYFKSKEEPKKVCFDYDLFLRVGGQPVHNIRVEKLTFQNPSEDFRRKLLKARSDRVSNSAGAGVPTLAVAPLQRSEEPTTHPAKPVPAIAEKKPRAHTAAKEPSKPTAPAPKPSQPFNDIFGSPIKPKHSPEPSNKAKESAHSNHQKQTKYPAAIVASKDPTVKDSHGSDQAKPKPVKPEKEAKVAPKRAAEGQSQPFLPEKKKKYISGKPPDVAKAKEEKEKKEKHKLKPSVPSKKFKHRSLQVPQHKDSSKSPKINSHKLSDGLSHNSDSNDTKSASREDPTSTTTPEEPYHSVSPMSRDMDNDLISPLSSSDDEFPHLPKEKMQPTNHNTDSSHGFQDDSCSKPESLKSKSTSKTKASIKKHKEKPSGTSSYDGPLREVPPANGELGYHEELVELQKKIISLNDQNQLQMIVDVIEKTGKYHMSKSTFDFDLCSLDPGTVRLLKNGLSA